MIARTLAGVIAAVIAGSVFAYADLSPSTGGKPGGTSGQVQYNNAGAFGGRAVSGTGTTVVTTTGAQTSGKCVTIDANGNHVADASACGGGGGGSGLFSQVLSATPTQASTGLSAWINQNGATISDLATGVVLRQAALGSSAISAFCQAAPATPYTITALTAVSSAVGSNSSQNPSGGIGWSDGTKFHFLSQVLSSASAAPVVTVPKYTNATTFSANDKSQVLSGAMMNWFQITDDGTNVIFLTSNNGISFHTLFSVAKASGFLGATGYSNLCLILVGTTTGTTSASILSWTKS